MILPNKEVTRLIPFIKITLAIFGLALTVTLHYTNRVNF